jgi:hypothetical protein
MQLSVRAATFFAAMLGGVLCGSCWAITNVYDYQVVADLKGSPTLDASDSEVPLVTDAQAPDAARPPNFVAGAHFLQPGQTVQVTLASGGKSETVTVEKNGPIVFSPLSAGSMYVATASDPNCWLRNPTGVIPASGYVELDLRCRLIRQNRSLVDPAEPALAELANSTASPEYEDLPLLNPLVFSTDIPSHVLLTLAIPANSFLKSNVIEPSGLGVLGLEVDGVVVEETTHRPMSEGQSTPNALVTLQRLNPGQHTVKVLRKVVGLTSASRYQMGNGIEGVVMSKALTATVLDSLESFDAAVTRALGPPTAPLPAGTLADLSASVSVPSGSAKGDMALVGLHAPDFGAQEQGATNVTLDVSIGNQLVQSSLFAGVGTLQRSASLLWGGVFVGESVKIDAAWSGAGALLLPRGARLFGAIFKDSETAPAPRAQLLSGTAQAGNRAKTVPLSLAWNAPEPTKVLLLADLARAH